MSQTESNRIRLEEIMAEIAETGERCNYPTLDLLWLRSHGALDKMFIQTNFLSEVASLEAFYAPAYYRELVPEGAKGGLVPYVKRVLRKLMKFQLLPLVQDQNQINANIMRTFQHVRIFINGELDRTKQLEAENAALKERLEALEARFDEQFPPQQDETGEGEKPCA